MCVCVRVCLCTHTVYRCAHYSKLNSDETKSDSLSAYNNIEKKDAVLKSTGSSKEIPNKKEYRIY